ncbi:MAG: hypothetical protein MK138_17120, partial [Planctomycetes bacterium]|nr:hypothetical protein [Planctomycetota bacterium]
LKGRFKWFFCGLALFVISGGLAAAFALSPGLPEKIGLLEGIKPAYLSLACGVVGLLGFVVILVKYVGYRGFE